MSESKSKLDSVNLLWVGGTGANVAMAFARLQQIGLIPEGDDVQHFLLDTPENQTDDNIAVRTFRLLGQSGPAPLSISRGDYTQFDHFLHNHQQLTPFFENLPDEDSQALKTTPSKDGNYYRPALASAIATFYLHLPEKLHRRTIICASCYGGTGAGVVPVLVRKLLAEANQNRVDVIYLNRWVVDSDQKNIDDLISSNENTNFTYLKHMSKDDDFTKGRLNLFLLKVADDFQQRHVRSEGHTNNTRIEIPNPFPYYAAMLAGHLLAPSKGKNPGGIQVLELGADAKAMPHNPAFQHAHAYSCLPSTPDSYAPPSAFDFVEQLMDQYSQPWSPVRIDWNIKTLKRMRQLVQGNAGEREAARLELQNERQFDRVHLDWPGFRVSVVPDTDLLNHSLHRTVSYPSLFFQFFYLQDRLKILDANFIPSYVALLGLVASGKVYARHSSFLQDLDYTQEVGAAPIELMDEGGHPIGYAAPSGFYAWPVLGYREKLEEWLRADKFGLRDTVYKLWNLAKENSWSADSVSYKCLSRWCKDNPIHPKDERKLGLSFFRPLKPIGKDQPLVANSRVKSLSLDDNKLRIALEHPTTHGDIETEQIELDCNEYGLLVLANEKRIIQYTCARSQDTHNRGGNHFGHQSRLVLSHQVCLDLKTIQGGWQVEILHPSFCLFDQTIEFCKIEALGVQPSSVLPWPIKKDYVPCMVSEESNLAKAPQLEGRTADLTSCVIRNWGNVLERDPDSIDLFRIEVIATFLPGSNTGLQAIDCSYQLHIWPCDPRNGRFVQNWLYHGLLLTVNSRKRWLHKELGKNSEHWWCQTNNGWQELGQHPGQISDTEIRGYSLDGPPIALALELGSQTDKQVGAWFPMPSANSDGHVTDEIIDIGFDLGESSTCAAWKNPLNHHTEPLALNPADLIYTVFANEPELKAEHAWVPLNNTRITLPSLLYGLETDLWEKHSKSVDKLLPLWDYSIPGDEQDPGSGGSTEKLLHAGIKWGSKDKLEDYLSCYLFFLAAQLYLYPGQNTNSRFAKLKLWPTLPLKFREDNQSREKLYMSALHGAIERVQKITGSFLEIATASTLSWESFSGQPEDPPRPDTLYIIIDVGASTTDAAVLKGNEIHSAGSFKLGGHYPIYELSKGGIYDVLRQQRYDPNNFDPLRGDDGSIRESFLHVLRGYTSLLVAASILQTGWQQDLISEKRKIRIELLGQSWHLARFHKLVSNSNSIDYIQECIKKPICSLFNDYIAGSLDIRLRLTPEHIFIDTDPLIAKTRCAIGAINPAPRQLNEDAERQGRINFTFAGLGFEDIKGKTHPWHILGDGKLDDTFPDSDSLLLNDLSPALLVQPKKLQKFFSNIRQMCNGKPFSNQHHIRMNVLEYLLEKTIADTTDKGEMQFQWRNVASINGNRIKEKSGTYPQPKGRQTTPVATTSSDNSVDSHRNAKPRPSISDSEEGWNDDLDLEIGH